MVDTGKLYGYSLLTDNWIFSRMTHPYSLWNRFSRSRFGVMHIFTAWKMAAVISLQDKVARYCKFGLGAYVSSLKATTITHLTKTNEVGWYSI